MWNVTWLWLHSTDNWWHWTSLQVLIGHFYSFLCDMLLELFSSFFKNIGLYFSLFSFLVFSSIYILDTSSLSDKCILNISSQFVVCLLIFLMSLMSGNFKFWWSSVDQVLILWPAWIYFWALCFALLIYLSTLPYANFHLHYSDRVIILFLEVGAQGLGKLLQGVVCSGPGSL